MTAALAAGAEVVVDRCNFDEQQRLTWLALARRFRAVPIGLQLLVPVEECIWRVCLRTDHPTLAAGNAPEVIARWLLFPCVPLVSALAHGQGCQRKREPLTCCSGADGCRFAHDFRPFLRHEGFAEVHVAYCLADIEAFLLRVGPARQHAPVAPSGGSRQPYAPLGPALPAFGPVCSGMPPAAQQESAVSAAAFAAVTGPPLLRSGSQSQSLRRAVPLLSPDQPTLSMRQLLPHPAQTPAPMRGACPVLDQNIQCEGTCQGQTACKFAAIHDGHASNLRCALTPMAGMMAAMVLSRNGLSSQLPPWSACTPTDTCQQLCSSKKGTPDAPSTGVGPGEQQREQQSNAVPFPGGRGRAAQGAPAAGSSGSGTPHRFLDEGTADSRPILLFDLNGTLTSHTAARRSAGVNLMRPGIHHLMRLHVRNLLPRNR